MHILAEITPLDPVAGTRPTLRVSSLQDRGVNGLNGVKWWPGITRKPSMGITLFDGDFSSGVNSGQISMEIAVTALEKLDANARRFVWAGASITVYSGATGQAWPWTKIFVGRVEGFRVQANKLSLSATVDEEPFQAKVLSATYAGTGGLEGGADIKGKSKPWAFGAPKNIEPILIDSINSVFQVSAYGTIKAVTTLYERGAAFSASFGNYADYTALVAASIPAGRWATCLASGLIRLGAPPYGVITADIEGDYLSSTWRRLPGAILQRICSALSISGGLIDTTSLNALDSALAALPAGGNISLYLTEQQEVIDLARDIAISCNAQAGVSWLGQLFTTRVAIASPVASLDAQAKSMPRVVSNVEIQVSPPYTRIQMGGDKCWRVQSFDEIAFQAELIDKGLYSASVVYRDGNIVSLDDGSRWLFVGATPVSGSTPTDVNTNWARMTNAVQSAAIAAAQAAADAAQADADAALTTLTNIASDSLLTPDEKPRVIQDRDAIVAEQAGIDAQASAFSITTEKTTYDTAVSALTTYLATLTSPVLWSNLTGNTTIVGSTFRQKFLDVYAARQALLNKIAAEAAKRADLALGSNLVVNSEFTNGLTGWSAGWDGDSGLPVTRGLNLTGSPNNWFGTKNVAWAKVTGTPAAGKVFDAYYSLGPGATNLDKGLRWAVPVMPGDRLYYSALVAGHRCNVLANLQFWDGNGTYVSEVASATAPVATSTTDFSDGDPTQATRVGAFVNIPNGSAIRFAFLNIRAVCPGGQADPYIFFSDGFIAKVDPNQTVPPVYTMGPGDRRATEGAPSGTLVAGVSADTVATATTNFNASNDRNSAAVAAPTVATDGTAVDHTLQSNGSADISFEWSWGGTEGDIDGFLVYLYQSSSASAYTFGTTPAAETVFTLPANKRAFILFGTAPDQYYSFAVQAYRSVDKDINAAGAIKSTLVKATGGGENPYRPSASVAFAGDVTGTVSGASAATVASGAGKANNGLDSSGNVLTDKVNTSSVQDNAITLLYSQVSGSTYYGNNAWQTIVTYNITTTMAADLHLSAFVALGFASGARNWGIRILLNGVTVVYRSGGAYNDAPSCAEKASVGAGTHTITLDFLGQDSSVVCGAGQSSLIADRRYK
ncbi:DUF7359 domain-containing protein [Sphingobium fluviale]|uniref:DUF7359 domain-containing protein n=1 Tax=Sphingobium fluviale TaxID=2506423 RepID=A0A4Q1KGX9_9SPHN|nr:hypothetical protein [Sphingobium fluviale]RXR28961.1 hypothetical protein EQG66_07740 [Sphingobium fluviale]